MWHEARRQGKKITGMLVDYRKRAERRRDYYESNKADPTQFLQIHGRQCKIHLDPNMATSAEKAIMMYWQDILVDRFDVRVHLDSTPSEDEVQDEEQILTQEERQINYERYRIIAQNSFLKIPEEKFLKQLHLEEQYGYNDIKTKKDLRTGVSIGFNYEESDIMNQNILEESDYDDSDLDLDVDLIINVTKLDMSQANEMNKHGCSFGMSSNDFYSFLINDLEEAEAFKLARVEEQEKALFSGRRSRRERRSHRERKLANRTASPPSYAAKSSPVRIRTNRSKSRSRSLSPAILEKITYITSFGEDEEPSTSKSVENRAKSKRVCNNKRNHYRGRLKYKRNTSRRYRRNSSTTSTSSSRTSKKSKKYTRGCRTRDYSSSSSSSQHSSHQVKQSCKLHTITPEPVKVLTRYYGRKKRDTSSSSGSNNSNLDSTSLTRQTPITNKKPTNNSVIERLKKKRQVLISKRFKADKIAEKLKSEREKLEQQTRDDELREMSLKLRRKQREIRHANDSYSNSSDSDFSSGSNNSSRSHSNCRSLKRTNRERSVSKERRRERGRKQNKSRRDSKDIDASCLLNKLVNY